MAKVKLGPSTLVYPMPAFLIGTVVDGKPDFMAAAWSGIADSNPPMISVAIRHHRYTYKGIRQNMTFSINVPSVDQAKETDYCGIVSGAKADKVKVCKFKVFYGALKTAPLIRQCPVNLECKVVHILNLGTHALVIGQVEETYVSEECTVDGKPDAKKINPLIFVEKAHQPAYYCGMGESVGKAFAIGKELKEKK